MSELPPNSVVELVLITDKFGQVKNWGVRNNTKMDIGIDKYEDGTEG